MMHERRVASISWPPDPHRVWRGPLTRFIDVTRRS